MRDALPIVLAVVAALLLAFLGLRSLPTPRSSPAEACAGSPAPAACRALVRAGGAPPDLQAPRDLEPARDARQPHRPLLAGLDALHSGAPVTAYRVCGAAAAEQGIDQAPAFICAARAALRLGWPARAAWLAQRALELQDDAVAHVLLGEALEAQRDAHGARVEYLRALDLEPDNRAALDGLRRVGGTPPPRPDLTGDLDEEQAHALA